MSISQRDTNLNIIVEAKAQYTKQLLSILTPLVYSTIYDEYQKASRESEKRENVLYNFQTKLKEIKKWNSDVIKEHVNKITDNCEYFNDIITAVFISNVRILTSVKMNNKKKKMKITIPSNDTFVHKIYSNSARAVYNNPYLFSLNRRGETTHEIHKLIESAIDETIRDLLPIQNILESYLGETLNSDEEDEDEEEDEEDEDGEDGEDDGAEGENNEEKTEEASEEVKEPNTWDDENDQVNDEPSSSNFFDNPDEDVKNIDIQSNKSERPSHNNLSQPQLSPPAQTQEKPVQKQSFFDDVDDD